MVELRYDYSEIGSLATHGIVFPIFYISRYIFFNYNLINFNKFFIKFYNNFYIKQWGYL